MARVEPIIVAVQFDRDPDLVSIEDGARLLGVSVRHAYELARRGQFPGAIRIGSRWRVSIPKFRRIVHGEPNEVVAS